MKCIMFPRQMRQAALGLAATGLVLAAAAAGPPARALEAALPTNPIVDIGFSGTGSVYTTEGAGPGELVFIGTGSEFIEDDTYNFTSDSLGINFTPYPAAGFAAQPGGLAPNDITIADGNFSGSDTLTAPSDDPNNPNTLDLSFTGTFSGAGGTLLGVNGGQYIFSGTATEIPESTPNSTSSGEFADADSTIPFYITVTELPGMLTLPPAAVPASGVLSPQAPSGNATFTALYGPLATSVPEASPMALLGLGLVPLIWVARRRQAAR